MIEVPKQLKLRALKLLNEENQELNLRKRLENLYHYNEELIKQGKLTTKQALPPIKMAKNTSEVVWDVSPIGAVKPEDAIFEEISPTKIQKSPL